MFCLWAMHPFYSYCIPSLINPFTPESDQCQNSPAASQEIWHHTVWRTWLFIAYSDEKWLYYKFLLHHSYNRFLKGWENTLFELRSERVNPWVLISHLWQCFHFLCRSPGEQEVMSLQFLCDEGKSGQWLNHWRRQRLIWWRKFAHNPSNFSLVDEPDGKVTIQVSVLNIFSLCFRMCEPGKAGGNPDENACMDPRRSCRDKIISGSLRILSWDPGFLHDSARILTRAGWWVLNRNLSKSHEDVNFVILTV